MTSRPTAPEDWLDLLESTLEAFDEAGGHRVLSRLFEDVPVEEALATVVLPYLHAIGERWAKGSIGVAQEHFASNVLRSRLSLLMQAESRDSGPLAVLACLPGEHHEFGLMAMALTLSRLGWRTCYLGPSTPTAELALTCHTLQPAAAILSAHRPTAYAARGPELRRLARTTNVYIGAQGASGELAGLCHATHLKGDPVSGAREVHAAQGADAGSALEASAAG
ncbi:MerR family transcriptional regulator [Intrasporangium oryzae NRRL B-24470]|uniref:MerR family transcriptional regulator n=1 Tax=Intrasporangium oryzae NRRL B-24470 TaxID=1386089 RepID=W9GCF8_9MICO|nr:B12-binding domain-containing protein [Intrasporangium oryzae]EWT02488.1 MerR family transcriptional regulator [Intrasporangium oryzae NRRL B-24470]